MIKTIKKKIERLKKYTLQVNFDSVIIADSACF